MLTFATKKLSPSKACLHILCWSLVFVFGLAILFGLLGTPEFNDRLNAFVIAGLIVFTLLIFLDGFLSLHQAQVSVVRQCPRSVAVNRWNDIALNHSSSISRG